jgi:hypothetical protein
MQDVKSFLGSCYYSPRGVINVIKGFPIMIPAAIRFPTNPLRGFQKHPSL